MKTIKPLRLSVLTRPFLRAQSQRLALTVIGMHTLGEGGVLLPETELWKTVSAELGNQSAIDLGIPKLRPEFLVSGQAYTCHQQDKTRCAVDLRVGTLRRQFLVSGDRYWLDGRATEPQAFDTMRLDWRHAFGGPGFAANPAGIGYAPEMVNGLLVQRLPNVERPGDGMDRPDRRPVPACPAAMDVDLPERLKLLGTDYGDQWRETLYPGFARDMDWQFFNAAAPEQRWKDELSIPAAAPYEIWNMHPEHAVLRGRLPDLRARGFVARKSARPLALEEVPLRLTTAWFFPDMAQVMLIFHGETLIAEDDAADITHVMPAMEAADSPLRPLSHYEKVFENRCNLEKGAIHALLDEELLPASAIGPWLDQIDARESILARNIKDKGERLRAELTARGLEAGHKARHFRERPLPKPFDKMPTLAELPEFIDNTRAYQREQQRKLEEARQEVAKAARDNASESRKAGFDSSRITDEESRNAQLKGPPKFEAETIVKGLAGIAAATGTPAMSAAEHAELQALGQRGRQDMLTLYRMAAHHQAAADPMAAEQNAQTRERVLAAMAADRDLSAMDLTGCDLSGLDLRGARMHQTLLEGALFQGTRLDGADLSQSVLVRADLRQASLTGCNLERANLSLARCENTNFAQARFERTQMEKLRLDRCCLDEARWSHLLLQGIELADCSLRRADLRYVSMAEHCRLARCDFGEARLEKVLFVQAEFESVDFSGATVEACSWAHTPLHKGIRFRRALLKTTSFVGTTDLREADFEDATLVHCTLRELPLDDANFRRATLDTCDFSSASLKGADLRAAAAPDSLFIRADFTRASLRLANLMNANLQKACLVGADLGEANLFRADVSQILITPGTITLGAHIDQMKTLPRRPEASGA
ncbi:DUF2169 family type VI secretion system accessory protein [Variovorax paradoxus]|uniref:DUF2169 family type VI secretion system accessory protein n=1 Tax=Variovorax paradoxus TaxID=34073 RepID=UPI002480EE2D|nr:DUF2169 domain-containing protein [Variovorax paradoxus]WGT65741.1 DUF2169 domain-containing protein [Variovorax paradoxus]